MARTLSVIGTMVHRIDPVTVLQFARLQPAPEPSHVLPKSYLHVVWSTGTRRDASPFVSSSRRGCNALPEIPYRQYRCSTNTSLFTLQVVGNISCRGVLRLCSSLHSFYRWIVNRTRCRTQIQLISSSGIIIHRYYFYFD